MRLARKQDHRLKRSNNSCVGGEEEEEGREERNVGNQCSYFYREARGDL